MNQSSLFIIAELSGNHSQDFQLALEMIDAAAASGVDAIKLQTYTPDTMTLNVHGGDFLVNEADSLWKGSTLYDLYSKAATPWEWHEPLFARARQLGMAAFSSPFDLTAVSFLESLNSPIYKIASFELTDIPLIRAVAKTRKPLIMSTGMASFEEIQMAVDAAKSEGNHDITLLKCTSTYPAKITDSNLLTLSHMREAFQCSVGLSDHTLGIGAAVAAVALGARVIEKHFVLDRSAGGVDAAFSLEPDEMASLVRECQAAKAAIGEIKYGGSEAEQAAKKYRRSIYVSCDADAGTPISEQNIRIVRPGFGLEPKYWESVLTKRFKVGVRKGQALSWDMIE